MKLKVHYFGQIACPLLGRAFCWAGAAILVAFNAQAQNLFVYGDTRISVFTPDGTHTPFATVTGEGNGLAFDSAGNLFVPNSRNGTITKIRPNGIQSIFASGLSSPMALAFDNAGNLFVSDSEAGAIYKYTPSGARSTFATGLFEPFQFAFNQAGDLFSVGQDPSGSGLIYEFTTAGARTTFATVPNEGLEGLAFDSAGNLFAAGGGSAGYIFKFSPEGRSSTFASGLFYPLSLAFNSSGDLFVSQIGEPYIERFTPNGIGSGFESSVYADGLAFQTIPEPSVWAILTTGVLVLFGGSRRRKRGGGGTRTTTKALLFQIATSRHWDTGHTLKGNVPMSQTGNPDMSLNVRVCLDVPMAGATEDVRSCCCHSPRLLPCMV